MNDYLPKNELEPKDDKPRVSNGRIAIWVIVGGIAVYLIATGVWGILTK